MAVVVTKAITANSALGRQIAQQINRQIAVDAERVAAAAVRHVDDIVAREFKNSRPGTDRRPGRHLLGSFTANVTVGAGGDFPVVITLRSSAPAVKVLSLNGGSAPHEIGGDGRKLSFPAPIRGGGAQHGINLFRQRQATVGRVAGRKSGAMVVPGPVHHPGTRSSWFMQRAVEQAVVEVYGRKIRLPRR